MTSTRFPVKATVVAVALAGLSLSVDAAGLGKLTVLSGLGQPLRAEIELSATKAELSSMSARLAPPDTFKQAGVEFMSAIAGVKFDIGKRSNGKPYVKLSSNQAVNEPFLDMLIQLDWAQGRLVREYTFLLDPPDALATRQQVAPGTTIESATTPPPVSSAPAVSHKSEISPKRDAPPENEAPATRKVRRGDTLRGIANEVKPEGVTVEQMLVAIFRANKGAFIANNMNRLRSGVVLTVPPSDTAAGIARVEAGREVRAQAASFNAYRRNLAEAASAAEAPPEAAAQQAASGKIAPRVEEQAPAAAESSDKLKISKSETAAAKGKPTEQVSQARIAALQEDLAAREKALKDTTARLSELEKSLNELQKLVELKNQSLAELQKQAAAKASEPAAPTQPEAAAPKPSPAQAPAPEATPATAPPPTPTVTPPVVEKAPEVAKAPPKEEKKPEPPKPAEAKVPPAEEPGFFSGILDNPLALYGGGGLALALLALFGYRASQRGKDDFPSPTTLGKTSAQSVFGATGGQSIDTSSSSIQTDFSHSGMTAIDADEGVDPVAEADVYMAYGRDAQAEEILLDALKSEPKRHAIQVKLLEIYSQRKSVKQFETLGGELYAQTGGVGGEWEKAAAMGRKLDPANPLYASKTDSEPEKSRSTVAAAAGGAAHTAAGAAALAASVSKAAPQEAGSATLRDTWTMPGDLNREAGSEVKTEQLLGVPPIEHDKIAAGEEKTEILMPDTSAAQALEQPNVEGDLNLGQPNLDTTSPASENLNEASGLDFDLGLDFAPQGGAAEPKADLGAEATVVHKPMDAANEARLKDRAANAPHTAQAEDFDRTEAFTGTESLVTRSVIDFDMGDVDEPEAAPSRKEAKPDVPVVDLERTDVAGTLIDFNLDELTSSKPIGDVAVMDLERTDVGGNLLDFNFELGPEGGKPLEDRGLPPSYDLSNIDLNLTAPDRGEATAYEDGETTVALGGHADHADGAEDENAEAATKLDLAKAYEEMGDQEGAKELLEEVLREGSAVQQGKARDLLAALAK